jgi:sulfite exporter TauE/SafE
MNLLPVIVAGLTTGGLSCFAVQGGLLASLIGQYKKTQAENAPGVMNDLVPTTAFLVAKIAIYTVFGAVLGLFGSLFSFNSQVQGIINIVVGIYMLGVALQFLNVHPLFRYFLIQPPRFMQRWVRRVAQGNDQLAAPALLGLATIVVPCGTTLAMEALAVSSGSALRGALILFTFTVSSSWVFFALGYATSQFSQRMSRYFYTVTAFVLIVLAFVSVNSGLTLFGSPYSFDTIAGGFGPRQEVLSTQNSSVKKDIPADFEKVQRVTITVSSHGYTSDTRVLKKGVPVVLTLQTKNSYSCANAFTIPSMNMTQMLPANGTETVTFTPEKSGKLVYSCTMGMYRGEFMVQ